VRLDSGDLGALAREVRRVLDAAGLRDVRIFASGNLDEYVIERLLDEGAPIDAFGVGTKMDVSADAPYLDMAYKLVRYDGRYVLKTSPGKETWTGDKQVYRLRGPDGRFAGDVLALADEPAPAAGADPLLQPVMSGGRPVAPPPGLEAIRRHCAGQLAALPEGLRRLGPAETYPVDRSQRLSALQSRLKAALAPERNAAT
jgi:nicotinate phosphoribosyltransferase